MEKRGRVMDAKESHDILQSTQNKKSMVSWFNPFTDHMISAIESRSDRTILGGMTFDIRVSQNGEDHIFQRVGDFVPMTRISLADLRKRQAENAVSVT